MSNGNKVARNIVTTILTQFLTWGLAFMVMLYLPRYLGAVNLGRLTLVTSLLTIMGILIPLGTSTAMVKDIARNHDRLGEYMSAALAMRLPLALLAVAVASGLGWALHYPPIVRTLIYVGSAGMVLAAFNDVLSSGLKGQERMQRMNAATLTEKVALTVLTLALVFAKAPLWMFAAVTGVSGLASLAVNITAFRASVFHIPHRETIRHLVHTGMPYFGWFVFTALYGQIDPIVIHKIAGDAAVGWYAVAFRLLGTTLFIPVAISSALLPTLSRLYVSEREKYHQFAQRALMIIMLCAVPISAVLIFQPAMVISLLHYGAEYANSIPVLRVAGVSMLLYYATCFIGPLVVSSDRQGSMMRISMIAVAIGVPACIGMTYWTHVTWGNGAIGAAGSDAVLELYLLYSYLRVLPAKTFGWKNVAQILRLAAASVPTVLLLALAARINIGLWILAPCAAAYLIMCWVFRAVTTEDVMLLKGAFARKVSS